MGNDTTMNSAELQRDFHAIYKDFFNNHDIVLSGDGILTWGADISHGVSSLRIKQKLPIKTFCGANINTSGKVTLGRVTHYSIAENLYKKDSFDLFFKNHTEDVINFLQYFLDKNNFSGGVEIDFLTEAPRGHGFSFSGVVSVLMTFLVYILTKKINPIDIKKFGIPPGVSLFNEIYSFSLELSDHIAKGRNTGANNYAVMVPDTKLPIIHFSEKIPLTPTLLSDDDNHKDQRGNPLFTSRNIYKDTLLTFLGINPQNTTEIPLDYGVIFTGMGYTFTDIESTRERTIRTNDRLDAFMSETLQTLPIKEDERIAIARVLGFDKHETSRRTIDNSNLRILEGLDHLLKNRYDDSAIDAFIDVIKNIGLMSLSYQKENKLFFALQYLFHQYRQFEDEEIGILPFNTGKVGGSLFFVTKSGKSRNTIQKVLNHVQQSGRIASLDYASWRDGYSADGVILEQYITEKVHSSYTKEGSVQFIDSFGGSYLDDYHTILSKEQNCILLDTIQGRIYLGGTKLTSKDIHSQNTTIDMMKLLLENIGKEVSNSELPVSTYSQNKNEILGKVILPIRKLSRERFGREVPIICSGGITNYYLKLEHEKFVRIGMIKKLGS